MRIRFLTLLLAATSIPAGSMADRVKVRTPSPVLHLADNLDESDGLGWCIDTVGRGVSDRLHAHSCKPQGGDVQFRFMEATGQIQSVAFSNKCIELESHDALRLFDCDDGINQRFEFDEARQRFQPLSDTQLCLTVGDGSRSAGPFMSRDLGFAPCSEADAAFQTWVIVE